MTVSDNVVVRSKPRVSTDSITYKPWLPEGARLEVLKGPVAASGYWWYRVELLEGLSLGGGITAGWVAAADHDGEAWIDWGGASTDPVPEPDYADFPTPELTIGRAEEDMGGDGLLYTYYDLSVLNWADYPAELFAPAPDLPPCGLNARASRTWVDITGVEPSTEDESRIYSFCALGEPEGLTGMWFAVPQGSPPPSFVYVTLWDRENDRIVVSNRVRPPWPLPTPTSSPSPTPSPPAAVRVGLINNGSFSCEGGALAGHGVPGDGFAILKAASQGGLTADVSLRGGLPNTTYTVQLIQSAGLGGSIEDCSVVDGTLITDSRGDGLAGVREARLPDMIGAFVYLVHLGDATGPLDLHGTRLVPVGLVH